MSTKTVLHLSLLAVVCGPLFFWKLADRDLWSSHEARAAQDAQRVLDSGDWVLPRLFDDQVELQKPPLYYWLVAAVGWLRGGNVDALAVRLPAALAAFGTVLAIYGFLATAGRAQAALIAALVLATTQHFAWLARTGRIDMPLTFVVSVAVCCHWRAVESDPSGVKRFALELAGFVAIAGGILLKGPIGFVLPITVLSASTIVLGSRAFRRSWLWGLPLVLLLAAPWFVAAHLRTGGEFTRVFFWYHNFQRAAGGADALATHPWWFYGSRMAFDLLPWSPLLIGTAWLAFRSYDFRADQRARVGAIWVVGVAILLSLSRFKRADYLLPAYPGAAIWLGCGGERVFQRLSAGFRRSCLIGGISAVLAGWAVILTFVVPRWDAEHGEARFAAAIRSAAPKPNLVLLFRVENHLLSYHLGRPLNTFLEWENLDVWVSRPESHFVVMPADRAAEWRQYITSGGLEEVSRFTDRTDRRKPRDLVLMRTVAGNGPDGSAARSTADQQGANQRAVAGLQPGRGP